MRLNVVNTTACPRSTVEAYRALLSLCQEGSGAQMIEISDQGKMQGQKMRMVISRGEEEEEEGQEQEQGRDRVACLHKKRRHTCTHGHNHHTRPV